MTNNSFISEATNYAELWDYLEQSHVYGMLTTEDADYEPDLSASLSTDQSDRLDVALNYGADFIKTYLRERYDISALDSTTAPPMLKELNARLAQHRLELRRYRSVEHASETLEDIKEELRELVRDTSLMSLDLSRSHNPVSSAVDSKATQFDRADQFGSIIPSSEYDDVYPDQYNA